MNPNLMTTAIEQTLAALVAKHGWRKVEKHLRKLFPKSNWNAWQTVHTYAARAAQKRKDKANALDAPPPNAPPLS